MELRDPFCAFVAETNLEAHFVANLLNDAGVAAVAQEDVSPVGVHWVGPLAEIHRPKVMIERAECGRAAALLHAYESRRAERRRVEPAHTTMTIRCDHCDEDVRFDESLRGTVQSCPHCGEFVDVDTSDIDDEVWRDGADVADDPAETDDDASTE